MTSILETPVKPCKDKSSVSTVSPLILNPADPAYNILPFAKLPDPEPPVITTWKSSLLRPFTHLRPDPAVAVALPLLTLIPVTAVLNLPDGFTVLLLFVFFTAV